MKVIIKCTKRGEDENWEWYFEETDWAGEYTGVAWFDTEEDARASWEEYQKTIANAVVEVVK